MSSSTESGEATEEAAKSAPPPPPVSAPTAPAWTHRWRDACLVGAVVLVYSLVLSRFAELTIRGGVQVTHEHTRIWLNGYFSSPDVLPALARWDSIWYYSIAKTGIVGAAPNGVQGNPAFFPLYGWLMGWVSGVLPIDPLQAGLWISRLATVGTLVLATLRVREQGESPTVAWGVVFAWLAYPAGFLLFTVLSESLFLFLVLFAIYLAEKRHWGPSAIAAALAAMTRVHAVALFVALLGLAIVRWRRGEARAWKGAIPAVAVVAGMILILLLEWKASGDPFLYGTIRRRYFGQSSEGPMATLSQVFSLSPPPGVWWANLGPLANFVWSLNCLVFVPLAGLSVWLLRKRETLADGLFVATCVLLTLVGGSAWGLMRYSATMYPVFFALGRLRTKSPPVWGLYVLTAVVMQGVSLVHWLTFRWPGP